MYAARGGRVIHYMKRRARRRRRLLLVDKRHFTSASLTAGGTKRFREIVVSPFFVIFVPVLFSFLFHTHTHRIIFESIKQNEAHANSTPPPARARH